MLALALALGVAAAAAAPPGGAMKLTLLAAGEGGNACLDGTPFGYYVATNSSSADWVIDIAGGGWCTTAAKCLQRIDGASSNRLASSSGWGSIGGGNGITSDSVADNPVFASYNRVSFPYCDGSSFTSHREEPLPTPNGSKTALLHMRGKNNLRAAIASLKKHHGMKRVRHLVVTGGSAGGTSTFLHTDLLGQLAGAQDVVGMPDAGAFRVLPPPACCAWADIVALHNATGALNPKCVAAEKRKPAGPRGGSSTQGHAAAHSTAGRQQQSSRHTHNNGSSAWRCFTAPTLLEGGYIQAPLFVLQSQFDHFQLSAMAHIPCSDKLDYYPPWTKNVTCSASDNKTIAAYGAGWKKDFAVLLKKADRKLDHEAVRAVRAAPTAPRALFMTACLQHEERTTAGWTGLKAGGVRLRDAFAAFHAACAGAGGSSGCAAARKLYLDDLYV